MLSLQEILSLFHESNYPDGRPATLLLDQIQYAPQWETEIKLLVDHKPRYRILATGSASVVHRDRLAESGVGRWTDSSKFQVIIPSAIHKNLNILTDRFDRNFV